MTQSSVSEAPVRPSNDMHALWIGVLFVAPFGIVQLVGALGRFPLDRMVEWPMWLLGIALGTLLAAAQKRLRTSNIVILALCVLFVGGAIVWENSQNVRREARENLVLSEICRDFEGQACRQILDTMPGRVCRLGLTPPARCEVELRRDAGAR